MRHPGFLVGSSVLYPVGLGLLLVLLQLLRRGRGSKTGRRLLWAGCFAATGASVVLGVLWFRDPGDPPLAALVGLALYWIAVPVLFGYLVPRVGVDPAQRESNQA
jgi:hypothetical protein